MRVPRFLITALLGLSSISGFLADDPEVFDDYFDDQIKLVDISQDSALRSCLSDGSTADETKAAYDKCFGTNYDFNDLASAGGDADGDGLPDDFSGNEACFYKEMGWVGENNEMDKTKILADMEGLEQVTKDSFDQDVKGCMAWSGNFGESRVKRSIGEANGADEGLSYEDVPAIMGKDGRALGWVKSLVRSRRSPGDGKGKACSKDDKRKKCRKGGKRKKTGKKAGKKGGKKGGTRKKGKNQSRRKGGKGVGKKSGKGASKRNGRKKGKRAGRGKKKKCRKGKKCGAKKRSKKPKRGKKGGKGGKKARKGNGKKNSKRNRSGKRKGKRKGKKTKKCKKGKNCGKNKRKANNNVKGKRTNKKNNKDKNKGKNKDKGNGKERKSGNALPEPIYNKLWCIDLAVEQALEKCVEDKIKN